MRVFRLFLGLVFMGIVVSAFLVEVEVTDPAVLSKEITELSRNEEIFKVVMNMGLLWLYSLVIVVIVRGIELIRGILLFLAPIVLVGVVYFVLGYDFEKIHPPHWADTAMAIGVVISSLVVFRVGLKDL